MYPFGRPAHQPPGNLPNKPSQLYHQASYKNSPPPPPPPPSGLSPLPAPLLPASLPAGPSSQTIPTTNNITGTSSSKGPAGPTKRRPFVLTPDTSIEFNTFALPPHAEIFWRVFRPIGSSSSTTLPAITSQTASFSESSSLAALEAARKWTTARYATPMPTPTNSDTPTGGLNVLTNSLLGHLLSSLPVSRKPTPHGTSSTSNQTMHVQEDSPQSSEGGRTGQHHESNVDAEFWLFAIDAEKDINMESSGLAALLKEITFEGLEEHAFGSFRPSKLYPSGTSAPTSSDVPSTTGALDCLMPNSEFQRAYSVFLLAARERIVEELISPSSELIKSQGVRVVRCARGVVLLPWDRQEHIRHGWKRGNDWGSGWGVRPGERRPWNVGSTIYITFSLHLLPAPQNLVLFVPHPTRIPFVPFNPPLVDPTPAASPVPVRLLPTGTLAYFLRPSNQMDTDRSKQAERAFWETLHSPSVESTPRTTETGWAVCWVPIGKSAEDNTGDGVVCCWPVELILSSASSNVLPTSKSMNPLSARKVSSFTDHSIGSGPGSRSISSRQDLIAHSSPSFGSSSATALPTSNLASIWKTLTSASSRHHASLFPASPPSSPAPSGANPTGSVVAAEGLDDQSRVVDPQDVYFEIASSGVRYLDSLVRERERERERQDEEKENEKRRKDATHPGSVTAGIEYFGLEPEGDDPGSDDLWGSDSGGDVGQAVDIVGKTVSTPSLHLPTMASSSSAALHQAIQRNVVTSTVLPPLSSRKSAEQVGSSGQSTGFTPLSVQEQQIAAADLGHLMDWSWEDPTATTSTSTNANAAVGVVPSDTLGSANTPTIGLTPQSSSAFNLRLSSHRRQTEEPSWAPVDAVTEDDFDFFDAPGTGATPGASFLSNETPAELPLIGGLDRQQSLGLSPAGGLAETSFGLSPLPSHMIGLSGSGSGGAGNAGTVANGPFSPVLMDVDLMANGSPNNHHLIQGSLNQASPSGSSLYAVPSPGSSAWTHGLYQQAKTPKTPFSPFVEIEEDENEDNDVQKKADRVTEAGPVKQEEMEHPLGLIEHVCGAAPKIRNLGLIPTGFEPVPFGKGHTLADGKYELGKFAFPSPVSLVSSEGEGSAGAVFKEIAERRDTKKRRSSEVCFPRTKKSGSWKEHLTFDHPDKAPSNLSTHSSRRPRRTTEPRNPSSLPTPTLLADLRLHYNQIADPRVGVIRRLQLQSFSRRNRSTAPLQEEIETHLPNDFQQQLRLSTLNRRFERPTVEDESETDDEWDMEDLMGFKNWTFTSPSLRDDRDAIEDETDALQASIDFLPYLANGICPSSSAGFSFSLSTYNQSSLCGEKLPVHTLNDSSSAQTPIPQQPPPVVIAAAATTPAWAPTPTSPPFGSVAKETTDEDIEILGAWLAREAVENSLLFGELKLKLTSLTNTLTHSTFSWDAEPISSVLNVLRTKSSKALCTLQSLAELNVTPSAVSPPSLETLQSPKFTIGCQGNIIKTSPLALRFWPKLGLAPAGGHKDVVAFAIYESTGPGMNSKVSAWLAKVGAIYESMGLGKHSAGSAAGFQHGLVAVDNTHLLESIYPIMSELNAIPHVIFYLISPRHLSSTSFSLRDVHSQLSIALSTLQSPSSINRFLTHVIPTSLVLDEPNQAQDQLSLSAVCLSVYDRLQRNVDRLVPRQLFEVRNITKSFRFPAFYISKPRPPNVEFSLSWPSPSLNVSNKHMFLHLAYGFSPNRDWLVACAVDERGQAHELKIWKLGREPFSFDWAILMLWSFFIKFSEQADVAWRMVISKLGLMEPSEINAWDQHLSGQISSLAGLIRVYITCADPSSPPFLSSISSSNDHTSFEESLAHSLSRFDGSDSFVDTSNTTFGVYPSYRIPYTLSSSDNILSSNTTPFSTTTSATASSKLDVADFQESILPLSNFSIIRVSSLSSVNTLSSSSSSHTISNLTFHHLLTLASSSSSALPFSHLDHTSDFRRDLAENMHSLSVLARERWGEWNPPLGDHLPLHLLAVARMCAVVDLVRRGEYGL
ncbi:Mediator complex, subunit Med13 [Phaffia rhodozyma]|uniref:Mediator of RNA polymerase II transcription subunit 13 n=1 Tax=Phaffia rhodozyma TaxID=264483 RepID=A0A0F7SLG6_PHARH|nr:Mediator complex, subunit Med13 [Phaffia rhodozyma]